ncbi:MAG TPA: DNA cytosine methyltransferase [Puia sp.]|nr:DNA cytosine methyltransferase [Puia sp.]
MVKASKHAIDQKIARLRAGGAPRVLDLFSGCGGLSLGLHAAGCEIAAAVENDPDAARSHGLNFHDGAEKHSKARDITEISPAELTAELGLDKPSLAFDIIIGGPPCQAFARVGRSKLREVAEHPEAFRHDPRAKLYIEYLDYVTACAPLAVIMENVPDILNHGGHNIAEEISEVLEEKGYTVGYTLLNASYYGVPQTRERMFLIAYIKEITDKIVFPEPTHWVELPSGYDGSRAVALKYITEKKDTPFHYQEPPVAARTLLPAITARQATEDLPVIDARHLLAVGLLKRGARRFDQPMLYARQENPSGYVGLMREWPGFTAPAAIKDHVIRYLPRDYPLFARMNPGDQYPEACQHAERMFKEKLAELERAGEKIIPDSSRWKKVRASIVPPYADDKFPNKWRKMEADFPARTLLAHLGKDGYSHIHYDSAQARTISVREAARLQSFPDGFVFSGTMNPAFRQIGNAVAPLMAKAIGTVVMNTLRALVTQQVPARKVAGVERK